MSPPRGPCTFNWVFEYQPIASDMITQPSCFKMADRNLLADEKGPHYMGQVVVWFIHLLLIVSVVDSSRLAFHLKLILVGFTGNGYLTLVKL